MNVLLDNISHNLAAYGLGGGLLLVAAGKCMPKPGSSFSWLTIYTWVYDTIQAVLPVPRTPVVQVPPTQPVPTPDPTKSQEKQ